MINFSAPYEFDQEVIVKFEDGSRRMGTISGFTILDDGYTVWVSGIKESWSKECIPEELYPVTRSNLISINKTDTFIEHDIVVDGVTIGSVEIEPDKRELSRLVIFEPYQNKGFGTDVVKEMISRYNIRSLWVRSDNERAIHVYEKCGFVKSGETMYEMTLNTEDVS